MRPTTTPTGRKTWRGGTLLAQWSLALLHSRFRRRAVLSYNNHVPPSFFQPRICSMLRRIFTLVSVLCLANAAFAADPVPEWIWSSDKPKDGEVVYFRKSFNLNLPQGSAAPKSAFMIVTCDNRWTVYFNGEKVSTGEEWQQPARVDLLKLLKNEKNVIAVEGKNDSGAAGLLVRLTITWPDDKKEMIVSDPSWI